MTDTYTEKQIEDAVGIFARWAIPNPSNEQHPMARVIWGMAHDFADLFATNNPHYCGHCGQPEGTTEVCHTPDEEHIFDGVGFDRERFWKACGLEPARPYST